jgi:quinol-cytochrome oxidoreductase complex cytochrome b subunit
MNIFLLKNNFVKFLYQLLYLYPAPANLTYFWNFGIYGLIALIIQLLTGILLAMHYISHVDYAFLSVEHIMRNVNFGWLLRYIHSNGASLFFIVIYIHIFRGMFFGSFLYPRELLWIVGVIIFILMIITAFFGYVLPWGQMSFWAATVITNLFSAIPVIGSNLVLWLWSGYSVSGATLTKFYSLHFVFPFVITALVLFHVYLLHLNGSNNPLGISIIKLDSVSFFPYYSAKDLFGIIFYIYLAIFIVLLFPNYLGHSDNYIQANPMITPSHIVPEWYLLPFYAILRAIPNKLLGVIAMGLSIVILAFLPILFKSEIRSMKFRPLSRFLFWFFLIDLYQLGIIGGKVAEYPYIQYGQFLTFFYFLYFLVIGPIAIYYETNFWTFTDKKKSE